MKQKKKKYEKVFKAILKVDLSWFNLKESRGDFEM